MSVETRASFLNMVRSISYQSESNDSPVQQRSGDATHFSSGMLDPFSQETEFGAFVRSYGGLGKDVVTELLLTRNGTLVPALHVAEQRRQQLRSFDWTNTNPGC